MILYWTLTNRLMIPWQHKEGVVVKSIIWYIKILWWRAQRINSWQVTVPGRGGKFYKVKLCDEGTPDIIACINGRFIGIEVKRDEVEKAKWLKENQKRYQWEKVNRREAMQQFMGDEIQKAGWLRCLACCCQDVDLFLRENNITDGSKSHRAK